MLAQYAQATSRPENVAKAVEAVYLHGLKRDLAG